MAGTGEMEGRVSKPKEQRRGFGRFFAQYLLFPALIIIIGFWFNLRLERAKQSFKHLELELKRIQAAQQMLNELFSGNPERAFIAERLITRIVDEELSGEIHSIVADYYTRQLEESASKDDLKNVEQIAMAAERIKSDAGREILETLKEAKFEIVVESSRSEEAARRIADGLREKGYPSDVKPTHTGDFEVTIGPYPFQEATRRREEAVRDGVVPKDTPIQIGAGR